MCSSRIWRKRILIIGHMTEIYGPVQALVNYSKKSIGKFVSILHPLPYSSVPNSECRMFIDGKCKQLIYRKSFKTPDIVSYFQHVFLTFYFVLKNKERYDVCIGIDNLNAFCGIVLRKLGIVNKVIFHVIDYTPRRFNNSFANLCYHFLDRLCVKYSDCIWNISERIAKIREEQGVERGKNLVVSVGIELEKIDYVPEVKMDRKVLVFVSHLTKSKGAELIIGAIEDVIKKVPDAKLEIIGTGPYEEKLKELVKTANLGKHIKFLGVMEHDKLMKYLPTRGVALATYLDDPNSITYFADPTKPKEYLACGLPVIITRVPWIAKEIEEKPMGITINYDKKELVNAIVKLLNDDEFYERCKENAKTFASELSWDNIFGKAFCESLEM